MAAYCKPVNRWKTESMAGKSCMKHTLAHYQTPSFPGSQMLWSMSTTCTTRQKPIGTARTYNWGHYQRMFLSWVYVSSHHPIFTSKSSMQHLLLSLNQLTWNCWTWSTHSTTLDWLTIHSASPAWCCGTGEPPLGPKMSMVLAKKKQL